MTCGVLRKAGFGLIAAILWASPAAAQDFEIVTAELPRASIGIPYDGTLLQTANAVGAVDWSFGPDSLLPLNFVVGRSDPAMPATGVFCWGEVGLDGYVDCGGNVQAFSGIYEFTIRARDGLNRQTTRAYTLVAEDDLFIITESPLPDAFPNVQYEVQFEAIGGLGNRLWSIVGGSLPAGFALSQATGRLSGVANSSQARTYEFTVRAQDTLSGASAEAIFELTVKGALRILTLNIPPLITGEEMQPFQLQSEGGENVRWSVAKGWSLPGSMELSEDGLLTGGVVGVGTYEVVLQALSQGTPQVVSEFYNIYVTQGVLGIQQTELPPAALNTPYDYTLIPEGGLPPFLWTFATLETRGLSIGLSTGRITGSPPETGLFSLPISVRDAAGTLFLRKFMFQVTNEVTILTNQLLSGQAGVAYAGMLRASGGQAPYRWELLEGNLPQGLVLDPVSGRIEGTPTRNEGQTFLVEVTDNVGRTTRKQFALVIGDGVLISTTTLPDAVRNQSYAFVLQAVGGAPPLRWTLDALFSQVGAPGNIFAVDQGTGVLGGTPDTLDTLTLHVHVRDATDSQSTRELKLIVSDPLFVTTGPTSTGTVGAAYNATMGSAGGRPPFQWSVSSGILPVGLALDPSTGVISGIPLEPGDQTFSIQVSDAGGQSAAATRTISIGSSDIEITTGPQFPSVGQPFSVTLAAQGGTPPYSWNVVTGDLGALGLALNGATGVVSGSPQPGTRNITFRVTDAQGRSGVKTILFGPQLPPLPLLSLIVDGPVMSGEQLPVRVQLSEPYVIALNGQVTSAFVPTNGSDPAVGLPGEPVPFQITAGDTEAVFETPGGTAYLTTGTTVGTITLDAVLADQGGRDDQAILNIPAVAPILIDAWLLREENTFTVIVDGLANTHQVTGGTFTFEAPGGALAQSTFELDLNDTFMTWFEDAGSSATGGQFRLTWPFALQGEVDQVTGVTVQLTNDQGSSNTLTAK